MGVTVVLGTWCGEYGCAKVGVKEDICFENGVIVEAYAEG